MAPAKKRPATTPPVSDTEIKEILNSLNKKQEEMMTKQGEMAKMITEMRKPVAAPKKSSLIKMLPMKKRTFSMKHTFKNVSKIVGTRCMYSDTHSFYGLDWQVSLQKSNENSYGCFLRCSNAALLNEWMVETNYAFVIQIASRKGQYVCDWTFTNENSQRGFGHPNIVKQYQIPTDDITVELEVSILKMKGVVKPRKFDESHRQFSDVILTVDGEDFYVLKKFLASRSSVFNSMFFSNFEEAGKDQIDLTGVDAADFQNFLETVHGEATIEDSNVEGLLHLGDFYISPFALKECEKFLLRDSKMTPEKKYQLSKQYKLEKLMEKCISEMEDIDVIRAEIANEENSRSTLQKLGARALELYDKLKEASIQRDGALL